MPTKKPKPPNPPPAPPPGPEPTPNEEATDGRGEPGTPVDVGAPVDTSGPGRPVVPVAPVAVAAVTPDSPIRSIGDVSLTVWNNALVGSPIHDSGEMVPCYDAAKPYTAMALTQAIKESSRGADETAQRTHNPLGLMYFAPAGQPFCPSSKGIPVFNGQLCLRTYPSWADAFRYYAENIDYVLGLVSEQGGSGTLEEFIVVYVGGPNCLGSRGANCGNGETWRPGGGRDAGSINLYCAQTIDRLNAAIGDTTPAPPPQPARDPLEVIMGGRYDVTYEWAVESGLGYYQYGLGHGLNGHQHTGIDVAGNLGQAMYSPGAGVVTCAGTGNGPGSWGTGCAAFADLMGHGAGRVEIMLDSGVSVILGHSSESLVRAGQRVKAGDKVATCGGMNGPHVHVEARIAGPNVYTIVNPRKHLKGGPVTPAPPRFPDLPDWLDEATFLLALPDARPGGPVTELVIAWMKENGRLPWKLTEVETEAGWVYVMTDMVVTSDGQTAKIVGKDG